MIFWSVLFPDDLLACLSPDLSWQLRAVIVVVVGTDDCSYACCSRHELKGRHVGQRRKSVVSNVPRRKCYCKRRKSTQTERQIDTRTSYSDEE